MANANPVVPPEKPKAKAKVGPDVEAIAAAGAGANGSNSPAQGAQDIEAIVAAAVADALARVGANPNAQVVPAVSDKAQTVQLDDGTKRQDF